MGEANAESARATPRFMQAARNRTLRFGADWSSGDDDDGMENNRLSTEERVGQLI
jgi:hypothetical protein